ncbi:hypothetical protein QM600_08575 [Rhodococcus sp. IEGM 1379]|nr:hypothetical protein [Rhodococcus sp. IEGM 1379]MDI9915295.1 hypothetical protein [Rhodococcus sp. IEGM 1379]
MIFTDDVLSGTPTAAGTYTFILEAAHGVNPDLTLTVTVNVAAASIGACDLRGPHFYGSFCDAPPTSDVATLQRKKPTLEARFTMMTNTARDMFRRAILGACSQTRRPGLQHGARQPLGVDSDSGG